MAIRPHPSKTSPVVDESSTAGIATDIAARKRAEAETLAVKDELAAEVAAMGGLHELSTRLLGTGGLQPMLEEVLDATIALLNADFGNLQLYYPASGALEIVAHRGFGQDFLDHFASVHDGTATCGEAMKRRARVITEDVLSDPVFAPHLAIAAAAGFRAVQSTPLVGRGGEILGMLSTHCRHPHRPSERELRLVDLYARQAADLIERERAEADRRQLASLVENSTDFIGIASLEGDVLFINPAGRDMVGLGREVDVQGTRILDYVHPGERGRLAGEVVPAVLRDGRWEGEVRFRHFATGASIPMLQHVFLLAERGSGRRVALATISRDMTERRRTEEALRAARSEVAHFARMLSMGELAASIAHEVNQPLAAIVANANACVRWLADGTPNLGEARLAAERIVRDGVGAAAVIARVRGYMARGERRRVRTQLDRVIANVIEMLQSEARSRGVDLHARPAVVASLVLVDPIELQQVLVNLALNAIEAVSAFRAQRRVVEIGTDPRGTEDVVVAVRDTGPGIAPQRRDRIFDAFYTTKAGGLGMGLAISRSIVEAHGGRLWATPNQDGGETFQFTLPLAPPEKS